MYLLYKLNRFAFSLLLPSLLILSVALSSGYAQDAAGTDTSAVANAKQDAGEPTPSGGTLANTLDPAQIAEGKTLFNNNCSSCHAVTGEVVVGPGLKGINERRPLTWLIPWIQNSTKVKESKDAYAVELSQKYNNAAMPSFAFSDVQIKNILAYIKSEEAGSKATAAGVETDRGPAGIGAGGNEGGGAMGGISSNLFLIVVVALLVVLLLVLVVLVMVVSVLTKTMQGTQATAVDIVEDEDKVNWGKVLRSSAFQGGLVILFLLVGGKATIDGLYNIGIDQGYAPAQPIAFSHKLHAGQYQIQCQYCHTGVNKGKSANIPSANICMNCHNAIKKESPQIQKIYQAIENDKPIEWIRVHNLPDFAYFNHAQHVNVGGVKCQQCHGEIQTMEVVQQRSSLTMGWCIDCHRKTDVNTAGSAYYDKLVSLHSQNSREPLKVQDIGGLECSKCHY